MHNKTKYTKKRYVIYIDLYDADIYKKKIELEIKDEKNDTFKKN